MLELTTVLFDPQENEKSECPYSLRRLGFVSYIRLQREATTLE